MYTSQRVDVLYANPSLTFATDYLSTVRNEIEHERSEWKRHHQAYRRAYVACIGWIKLGDPSNAGEPQVHALDLERADRIRHHSGTAIASRTARNESGVKWRALVESCADATALVEENEGVAPAIDMSEVRNRVPVRSGAAVYSNGDECAQQVSIMGDDIRLDLELTPRHPCRVVITAQTPKAVSALAYGSQGLTSLSLTTYRSDAIQPTTDALVALYTTIDEAIQDVTAATTPAE